MYVSQFITLILLFIYLVLVTFFFYFFFSHNYRTKHGTICTFGTSLIGLALFIFRIFRGPQTKFLKYVHLLINLIALILLAVGYAVLDKQEDGCRLHEIQGYLVLSLFIGHFVVAICVFSYVGNYMNRIYYAPVHDIIGLWLFIMLVGTLLVALQYDKNEQVYDETINTLLSCIGLSGFIAVVFVVLCPYTDWELTGPI